MPARAVRLPLVFSSEALASDLALVPDDAWVAHFSTGYHDGGWSGVALRAPIGALQELYPEPGRQYRDTPLLAGCALLRQVLSSLECPLRSARLLRLEPGSVIREHRDDDMGGETGEVRLHVPIATNPDVEFYLDGDRLDMQPGELWYVDVRRPHRVQNLGDSARIHLVIDCEMNEWLAAQIAAGEASAPRQGEPGRLPHHLGLMREEVFAEPALQEALWRLEDPEALVEAVVHLAQQHGRTLTREDVYSEMRKARRSLLGRWRVG